MNVGDKVRVLHPTGGVLPTDRFEVTEDRGDGMVEIAGQCGAPPPGIGRKWRSLGFHKSSLEVVDDQGESQSVDATAVHPLTVARKKAESEFWTRCGNYADAVYREMTGQKTYDWTKRKRDELMQALQAVKDACYAEMDDGHGLGKDGLDAAREVIEDAVWFPINRPERGLNDAYLVDEHKMRALAKAIAMEDEL